MIEKWNDQKTPALAIVARGDQIKTIIPNNKYTVQSQSNPENYYTVYHYEEKTRADFRSLRITRYPFMLTTLAFQISHFYVVVF